MPDDFITLTESAPLFPTRPHKNSIVRWASRGCYGVKLKTVRFGGKRLTRPIWVEEFNHAVMRTTPDVYAASSAPTAAHQHATAKLDEMGIS
jgi:hypothetical protein